MNYYDRNDIFFYTGVNLIITNETPTNINYYD